mmetsp:Transcript_21616/g.68996  ORF Transcript_21616/g.68996 Transcript_21616/m.68996 type:complete len:219 (+) Transcript_21616:1364-2020(+)
MSSMRFSSMQWNISLRPRAPSHARAWSTGRPSKTPFAPRTSALRMSMELRKPLSTKTSHRPATRSITSGRSSTAGGAQSHWRPPWFETTMPLAPMAIASSASSGLRTPFTITGSLVCRTTHLMSSHESVLSLTGILLSHASKSRATLKGVQLFGSKPSSRTVLGMRVEKGRRSQNSRMLNTALFLTRLCGWSPVTMIALNRPLASAARIASTTRWRCL